MQRKKAGYILLVLLVITGLAGTTSNSISGKERRIALNLMKSTKSDILQSFKELSNEQLDFKTVPGKWPAKEVLYHIVTEEKYLWQLLEASLKSSTSTEKYNDINLSDKEVIELMENHCFKPASGKPGETYSSVNEAINDFKKQRTAHIEYIKSTTEDLRSHIVKTPFGRMDCYQLCLAMAAHSRYHIQPINETGEKAFAGNIK